MPIYRNTQTVEAMQWRGPEDTAALAAFLKGNVVIGEAGYYLFLAPPLRPGTGVSASQAVCIVAGDYVLKTDTGFALFGDLRSGRYFADCYELVTP